MSKWQSEYLLDVRDEAYVCCETFDMYVINCYTLQNIMLTRFDDLARQAKQPFLTTYTSRTNASTSGSITIFAHMSR